MSKWANYEPPHEASSASIVARYLAFILLICILGIAAGMLSASCGGAPTDPHFPGDTIRIWVPPSAEQVHPGLRDSIAVNIKRWCASPSEFCNATLSNTPGPLPKDWIVVAGGSASNFDKPDTLATTDWPRRQLIFYATKLNGDRIYLRQPGECRTVLPPGQRDAEINVIVGHEMGHMFGIVKHSTDPKSIMHSPVKCDDRRP